MMNVLYPGSIVGRDEPIASSDGDMAELVLLLPAREVDALEEAARQRGLTTGQVLRCLIREFLDQAGRSARERGH